MDKRTPNGHLGVKLVEAARAVYQTSANVATHGRLDQRVNQHMAAITRLERALRETFSDYELEAIRDSIADMLPEDDDAADIDPWSL